MAITIKLRPASDYRRKEYGVLFESEGTYSVTGKGVHNRHFPHRVEIWTSRPSKVPAHEGAWRAPTGALVDGPELSFVLNAESMAICANPAMNTPADVGALAIGDTVELEGFGRFVVTAKPLHDPTLIPTV
jgi:hypothetical protein